MTANVLIKSCRQIPSIRLRFVRGYLNWGRLQVSDVISGHASIAAGYCHPQGRQMDPIDRALRGRCQLPVASCQITQQIYGQENLLLSDISKEMIERGR